MNQFLKDLWAKYAHVRTVLLGFNSLQGYLIGLHPSQPTSARIVSGAIWVIGVIVWYLKGPHTDVTPLAPGTAPKQ